MKRNRRADWRRIKGKTSYTFDEAARALKIHRNTVRHWVRAGGLPALTGSRPHLILGSDLIAFLRDRQRANKQKCGPGELYCLRCRKPRAPVPGLIQIESVTATRGKIVGMCSACEALMHRFVAVRHMAAAEREFAVQSESADGSLVDSGSPGLNCHITTPDIA
jgi:excisionase family DNA binding protein